MKIKAFIAGIALAGCITAGCSKKETPDPVPDPPPASLFLQSATIGNTAAAGATIYNVAPAAAIRLKFSNAVNRTTVPAAVTVSRSGSPVTMQYAYENSDSTIVVTPQTPYSYLTSYRVEVATTLKSAPGGSLLTGTNQTFITQIDSTDKFPTISDAALMDTVQRRTFAYFWDFGHPTSGLARERNTDLNTVTSGGSGFGIMCIPIAINRNFITRAQGLARMQTIVAFLKNTAQTFHGAYPHWLNGSTGVVIPFSTKDNGADLVETSYLIAGLLAARQYFNGGDATETALRNDINVIWNRVEWDWFRNGGQNVLYWHWSPNYNWEMNHPIRGWNECLITYILAASSTTHGIPQQVYTSGWAGNGANGFTNGNMYYGYQLPLGPPRGGPLFFAHYSFLGINPNGLSDVYANYLTQNQNHTKINYEYCRANPNNYFGYSNQCWGLTASDVPSGYNASSPTNDIGTIAPTAALSSFPYTPTESMAALKFFYYKLGDKLFKEYGFVDAFSLHNLWFANTFLAIDQGPIMIMMENHRSGLVWNLLSTCPEVKNGLKNVLGFTAPYL